MPKAQQSLSERRELDQALFAIQDVTAAINDGLPRIRDRYVQHALALGASWTDIAEAVGLNSRQHAQKKFGHLPARRYSNPSDPLDIFPNTIV